MTVGQRADRGPDYAVPGVHGLTQMLVMPLLFLSGALYPLSGRPARLSVLTRITPLAYVVPAMRQAVFRQLSFRALGRSPAMVAVMGLGLLTIAIAEFRQTE